MKKIFASAVAFLSLLAVSTPALAQYTFDPATFPMASTSNTSNTVPAGGSNTVPAGGSAVVPAGGSNTTGTVPAGGSNTGGSGRTGDNITATTKLQNPLKGVDSIGEFFYTIINFVYSLSYAVIAFFLIYSGFKFVMAQGNPEELGVAKDTLRNTIIGAIILISANVITEVVREVINQFVTTPI